MRRFKYIALGCLTYVPHLHDLVRRGTGGTNSARYCYAAWLRHFVLARKAGLLKRRGFVAELGPGDSLGIGLSALLSGFDQYYAFDRVAHASASRNLLVLDELLELFQTRADIPGDDEFPFLNPRLDNYAFPAQYLSDLDRTLSADRVGRIREDLKRLDGVVRYVAPWDSRSVIIPQSVDMIVSQAVLEHIDYLQDAYHLMHDYLRSGGVMSHQIDFKSHETASKWNGHLAYSETTWRLMRGKLPYLLNRQTYSCHRRIWEGLGLKLRTEFLQLRDDGLTRDRLASDFRELPEQDLHVAGAFVQLVKT